MKTATYVGQANGMRTDARIYRLNPPLEDSGAELVIVSALDEGGRLRETFIFACSEDGEPADLGELPGSIGGVADHAAALRGLGYAIVEEDGPRGGRRPT